MKSISGNSFEVGAKVIVDWRGCFYQAKIVRKNTTRTDNKHYFVHFNGWSSNHDEWKCLDVIYPLTGENQKTLDEHHEFIKQQRNTKTTGKGKRKALDDSDDKKLNAKKEKRDRSEKSGDDKSENKSEKSYKSGESDKFRAKLSEKSKSEKWKTDKSKIDKVKSSKSEKSEKSNKFENAEKCGNPLSDKSKPDKIRSKPAKIKNTKSSDEVSKTKSKLDKDGKSRGTENMPPPKKDVRKYTKRTESENHRDKNATTTKPSDSKLTDSNGLETTSSRRNRTSSFSSNVSTAVSTLSNNSATTTQTVISTRTSRSAKSEMIPLPATPKKGEAAVEEKSKLIDTYIKNKDNCLVYVGKTSKDIKSLKDLKNVKHFKDGTIDKTLVQTLTSGQNFSSKPSNLGNPEMKREDTVSISNSTISHGSGAAPASNWLEEYKTAYNTGEIEQIYWEGEIVMIKSADNGKPKVGEITEAIQSRTTKKLKYRVKLKNEPDRDLGLLDHSDLSKLGGELRPRKRTSNQGNLNQSFGQGQGISPGASSQKGDKNPEKLMSPKKEKAASVKHVSPLAKNDKIAKNLSRTFEAKSSESQPVDQPSSHEIVQNWYKKLDPNNMSNDSSSEVERESSVNSPLATANSQASQGSSISQVLQQNIQNSIKNTSNQNPSNNKPTNNNPSNQNPSVQNTSNENPINPHTNNTANDSSGLVADSTISPSTTSPTSAINSGAKRNSTARRQEKLQSLIRTHFQEPNVNVKEGGNSKEVKTRGKRSESESRVDGKTEEKTENKRDGEKKKPGKKSKHKCIPVSRVGSERTTFSRQKSKNSVKPLIPSYRALDMLGFQRRGFDSL